MLRRIVLFLAMSASLGAGPLLAQDVALGQKYGQGVHDYFSGDYLGAYEQLTSAIQNGSKDPRVYYYRGLTYLKLGRRPEALNDFRKGADFEASDVNKFYNAAKSLERVQGAARVELENYRVNARMAVANREEKLRKARYEALQREEQRVLRMQPAAEPEPIETPEAVAEPAEEPKTNAEEKTSAPAPKKSADKPAPEKHGNVLGAMSKAVGKAIADKNAKPADAAPPADEVPAEKPAD